LISNKFKINVLGEDFLYPSSKHEKLNLVIIMMRW